MPIVDLASERPYAAALSADLIPTRCLFCFSLKKSDETWKKCDQCGAVFYCNELCLKEDAFDHKPECTAYRNWNVAQRRVIEDCNAAYGDEKLRLLARIIRRQRRDKGNVDLTSERPSHVKVRRLSDLMSHRDDLQRDAVRSIHLQDYVSDLYGFFANTTEEMSPFYTTVDEIEDIVGKMCINCFGIPVTTVEDETHIGVAVYLTSSRFDHSCKPNLFMDFDGNRLTWRYYCDNEECKSPDYDKLWVSYGYTPLCAGYTAVPTRQQRQLSLVSRYYFVCKCEWCTDEVDADLCESATTRLCRTCGQPYLFQPDCAAGFTMRQSCRCPEDQGPFNDCFEQDEAARHLDQLLKTWCVTFHPAEPLQSATEAVSKLEPVRRLAHRYWHPTLNLRYAQINETLFHAYRAIALSTGPSASPPTVTIFPIPEPSTEMIRMKDRALVAACLCGEMAVAAYQRRLEPHETVVARFCFQIAELCEMSRNWKGAVKNYQRALEIWEYHGRRGDSQCKVIEGCIERASVNVAGSGLNGRSIDEGVRRMAMKEQTEAAEMRTVVENGDAARGKVAGASRKKKSKKAKK